MISDGEARQYFQDKQNKPCSYGGPASLQIARGKLAWLWKDAHPGGCKRHLKVFNEYGAIPKYCFECYKVLIEPRTVVELFKLLIVFENIELPDDNSRKCLTEERADCSGSYKGLIYCRGIKEGEGVRDVVREIVKDKISPDIPVTLKRGCSEYALAYPAYSPKDPSIEFMKYNEDWQAHEDSVDQHLVIDRDVPAVKPSHRTPYSPSEIWAMCYWVRYAATIRDVSYLTLTGYPVPPIPGLKRPPSNITV